MAMTAGVTSSMARKAASRGEYPSSMSRSTFSTTTIASSTTMPIASTRPNSDSVLIEKPNAHITANVPTSDTGTATSGTTAARQLCRNTTTTSTTSAMLSSSVMTTSRRLSMTNSVVLYGLDHWSPGGQFDLAWSSFILAVIRSAVWIELVPGSWKMAMPTDGLPSSWAVVV